MNTYSYAPVLISVYNRLEHLKKCVDALRNNPEASKTSLYIVSDGPKERRHEAVIQKIREYIKTIDGFAEVNTRFRETNWGMEKSGLDSIEWVLAKHDFFIHMEDDIICSLRYLQFMNEALLAYHKDSRIFCVCAHTHPSFHAPRGYSQDVFLWKAFSPWGFGTWRGRWLELISSTESETQQLKIRSLWREYARNRPVMGTRESYIRGNIHYDARINLHLFLNDQYAVFPARTLTVNAGMDGSGTHCALGRTYPKQAVMAEPVRISTNLQPSEEIRKNLYKVHYSAINHGIGNFLRRMGVFDYLFRWYRRLACKKH